ncbi:hypothetical protein HK102_011180 [Quaeritorhiza haematococci]|nr:hypothetical protein HK102_011180 [Quaeritorhiza haematococci]
MHLSRDEDVLRACLQDSKGGFSKTALSEALVAHLAHYKERPITSIINKLLNVGADIHFEGEKPLAEVCKRRLSHLVKIFLDKGANPKGNPLFLIDVFPSLCDKSANGSMHVYGEAIGILRLLTNAGADLNANDGQLLINACAAGHLDLVQTLVFQGVNANARNGQALVVAAKGGHVEVVMALLKAGVNVQDSLKDSDVIAVLNRYQTVLNVLKDRLEPKRSDTASNGRGNSGSNNRRGNKQGHSGENTGQNSANNSGGSQSTNSGSNSSRRSKKRKWEAEGNGLRHSAGPSSSSSSSIRTWTPAWTLPSTQA